MDVQVPGSNLAGITDPELAACSGSAARCSPRCSDDRPSRRSRPYEQWDEPYPHPFQTDLAAFVNLADDYARLAADAANQATTSTTPSPPTPTR